MGGSRYTPLHRCLVAPSPTTLHCTALHRIAVQRCNHATTGLPGARTPLSCRPGTSWHAAPSRLPDRKGACSWARTPPHKPGRSDSFRAPLRAALCPRPGHSRYNEADPGRDFLFRPAGESAESTLSTPTAPTPGACRCPCGRAPTPPRSADCPPPRWARGWDYVDVVFVTGDAYVDHPSFAMAMLAGCWRRPASAWPSSASPTGTAASRGGVRPAAAVLRRQRRQHGLDDQPLHGQPQGPQRRRLLARRPDRPAARPGHAGLLPPRPRGVSGRAGDCRRRRGVAAPAGPLRLLERQGPPLDPARLQGRPGGLRHGRAADRRDRPAPGGRRRRSRDLRDLRGVAYGLGARESTRSTRCGRRHASCPATDADARAAELRGGHGRQAGLRRGHAHHPQRNQPVQRPAAGAAPRPRGGGRSIRRRCRCRKRRWTASTACLTRAAPHPPTARPIPAYEMVKDSVQIMRGCFGGCTFCSITAHEGRIIQAAAQESVLDEVREMAADPEFRAWSATSAARRPTCTRCAARGPRSRPSAGG